MRVHKYSLPVGLMLAACGANAAAGDIFIICNSSVSLKPDEIKDVFFGDKEFAGSVKLAPADNGAAQADFLEKVMKVDAKKYTGIWIKKAFRSGSTTPSMKSSDAEAIAFVKQTPGACGYVASAPGAGVVVVAKY